MKDWRAHGATTRMFLGPLRLLDRRAADGEAGCPCLGCRMRRPRRSARECVCMQPPAALSGGSDLGSGLGPARRSGAANRFDISGVRCHGDRRGLQAVVSSCARHATRLPSCVHPAQPMSPVRPRHTLGVAWITGLSVVGGCCDDGICCGVPDSRTHLVEPGLYAGATGADSGSSFPQAGGSGFRLEVDRSARIVRVMYKRGGETVEEFWRVAASDTVSCWRCPR